MNAVAKAVRVEIKDDNLSHQAAAGVNAALRRTG
jgi:hypothetical protein